MDGNIEEYISEYSADLSSFCVYLCRNTCDAEDLFQETWYRAIKSFKRYKTSKPFDRWLFTICANIYKDNAKLSYNKKRYTFISEEEQTRFLMSIPDVGEDERDEFCVLHAAIEDLSPKLRAALTLYYFKDYSVSEISDILKIPEGTVKSRLNQARRLIKRRLEEDEKDR